MHPIKQALLSVSDKDGILDFARALHALGVRLLSTGGTAKLLKEAGIPVNEVADYTGFPEMLDGRVKTLHPKVHGGLLARRDQPEHMDALAQHGISTIDLLVVNLYPFQKTVARLDCSLEEAIENIDIPQRKTTAVSPSSSTPPTIGGCWQIFERMARCTMLCVLNWHARFLPTRPSTMERLLIGWAAYAKTAHPTPTRQP